MEDTPPASHPPFLGKQGKYPMSNENGNEDITAPKATFATKIVALP